MPQVELKTGIIVSKLSQSVVWLNPSASLTRRAPPPSLLIAALVHVAGGGVAQPLHVQLVPGGWHGEGDSGRPVAPVGRDRRGDEGGGLVVELLKQRGGCEGME